MMESSKSNVYEHMLKEYFSKGERLIYITEQRWLSLDEYISMQHGNFTDTNIIKVYIYELYIHDLLVTLLFESAGVKGIYNNFLKPRKSFCEYLEEKGVDSNITLMKYDCTVGDDNKSSMGRYVILDKVTTDIEEGKKRKCLYVDDTFLNRVYTRQGVSNLRDLASGKELLDEILERKSIRYNAVDDCIRSANYQFDLRLWGLRIADRGFHWDWKLGHVKLYEKVIYERRNLTGALDILTDILMMN